MESTTVDYPDYETTKIDGFTIPKMMPTTASPEVSVDKDIHEEIDNITEMVKKIVEEEKIIVESSETLDTMFETTTMNFVDEDVTTSYADDQTITTTLAPVTTSQASFSPRTTSPKSKLSAKYPLTQSHFNIVRTIPSLLFKPRFLKN